MIAARNPIAQAPSRARGLLGQLSVDELRALIRFAKANRRFWKDHLLTAWATGRDEREVDASALRRVRNTIGPSGLSKFALGGLEAELAARGAGA